MCIRDRAKVEPFQQGDFEAMYRIMGERPMTIRYLDPPLHEFLPTKDEDIKELAADMGMTYEDLKLSLIHIYAAGHRGRKTLYYRFSVMAEAFQRPSSFTMVMVPDTCAAAVLSVAVSRAAEKS